MENQKLLQAPEHTTLPEKFEEPTLEEAAKPQVGDVVEVFGDNSLEGYVKEYREGKNGELRPLIALRKKETESPAANTAEPRQQEIENTEIPREKELDGFDLASVTAIANREPRKRAGLRLKIGAAAATAAALAGGALPAAASIGNVPKFDTPSIEQVDPGITPYESEKSKAAATFGTPEFNTQTQFGDAERSWEVEGKTDKWKLSAPLNNETPQASIDSLLEQAKTNVDLLATMAIGCELADCSAANELADKLAKGTAEERSKLHAQIAKKFADEKPAFGAAYEYATPYIDAEKEMIGYNEHRITNGVQTVEVSFGKWNTDCGQFVIEGEEQIEESGIRTLPVVDVPENEITTVTPADSPTNVPEIPFVPDTPTTPEVPNTPETPEVPQEPEEPETPIEEEPPVVAEEKHEEDNIYNHVDEQLQNGDDRFENSPETPDRSGEIPAERGTEPARPVGEGPAEGTTPVAPETQEQNEQIQPEQGTNTELTPEQQQELIDQGAGELEDGEGNNGRIGE